MKETCNKDIFKRMIHTKLWFRT